MPPPDILFMPPPDILKEYLPNVADRLPREALATLPTPVRLHHIRFADTPGRISIKYDNLTGNVYGGNKVRKLEYIFPLARKKRCLRIATFGAAGSNHALATALYARQSGFECTCFLARQATTPLVAATLNQHLLNGTELVHYGGDYRTRIKTLREHLWGRHAWVIPMGGSSWLGTVGFVAAGLELAAQIAGGEIPLPDRLYVGAGTMGTAVGIALGLSLAGLHTEVHAVRVSDVSIMNQRALDTLLKKTARMLRRVDSSVPEDLATRTRIRIRDEFFGPGYAQGTEATARAIAYARDAFDLNLETTYTGKVMSALLDDWRDITSGNLNVLYWHTYNSVLFDVPDDTPVDALAMPEEFLRYFGP
jgi:D-cysteine desulfhydrase